VCCVCVCVCVLCVCVHFVCVCVRVCVCLCVCDEWETTAYLLLRQYSDELHVAASLAGGHSMVHRSEVGTVYLQIPLTIFGDSLSYMESSNTHTMMMVA